MLTINGKAIIYLAIYATTLIEERVLEASGEVIKGQIWKGKKVILEHIKSYNDFSEGEDINLIRCYVTIQEDNIN